MSHLPQSRVQLGIELFVTREKFAEKQSHAHGEAIFFGSETAAIGDFRWRRCRSGFFLPWHAPLGLRGSMSTQCDRQRDREISFAQRR